MIFIALKVIVTVSKQRKKWLLKESTLSTKMLKKSLKSLEGLRKVKKTSKQMNVDFL